MTTNERFAGLIATPLRLFLGLMFVAAGIEKITDPAFFDPQGATYIGRQLQGFVDSGSPLGFLIQPFIQNASLVGWLMTIGEIAVGLAMLLGLFTRVAAVGGFLISLTLFLTATWDSYPFYTGADLPYMFGWLTLFLAGGGPYSVDALLARRNGVKVAPANDYASSVLGEPATDRRTSMTRIGVGVGAGLAALLAGTAIVRSFGSRAQFQTTGAINDKLLLAPNAAPTRTPTRTPVRRTPTRTAVVCATPSRTATPQRGTPTRTATPRRGTPTRTPVSQCATPTGTATPRPLTATRTPQLPAPPTNTPMPPPAPTRTAVPPSGGNIGPNSTPAGGPTNTAIVAAPTPAGGVVLARIAGFAPGTAVDINEPGTGYPGTLVRRPDGSFAAFSAICTHQGCAVGYPLGGQVFRCPCHGSEFSIVDGDASKGPARTPLARIPIRVDEASGNIYYAG